MKFPLVDDEAYKWVVTHGTKIIFGLFVFVLGLWFIQLIKKRIKRRFSERGIHSSFQPFFLSLTITALHMLLVLIVMQIVGIQATMFTTLLGAFGVAAGLALSGTLQNFAGGVLILLLKPFEINDNIIAQGQDGKVTSIQIFYTVLLTGDNKTVIIPNGKLFNEVIVNVTRAGSRRLDFEFDMGYVANPELVKSVLNEVVKDTPGIIQDKPVRVGVVKLAFDRVTYIVQVWVTPSEFLSVKVSLMERIIAQINAAGVKLPGT